ncbi:uncharacterized protein BKA78DRAFT_364018 [Phyllosticta capitalensis]|uniref:uncharacterized protein n=1 Tax=Phyllosticta capitalensis TaxID=121624 RepID=UPI0031320435
MEFEDIEYLYDLLGVAHDASTSDINAAADVKIYQINEARKELLRQRKVGDIARVDSFQVNPESEHHRSKPVSVFRGWGRLLDRVERRKKRAALPSTSAAQNDSHDGHARKVQAEHFPTAHPASFVEAALQNDIESRLRQFPLLRAAATSEGELSSTSTSSHVRRKLRKRTKPKFARKSLFDIFPTTKWKKGQ